MKNATDTQAKELRSLAARMLDMADAIEEETSPATRTQRPQKARQSWDGSDAEWMLTTASQIYRTRRRRQRFIAAELLGEPAWDLLLDLFIARLKQERISVTSACQAADVPPTTALRWLGVLSDARLVERLNSETDQRVTWVRITDYGATLMADLLRDMANHSTRSRVSSDKYLILDPPRQPSRE